MVVLLLRPCWRKALSNADALTALPDPQSKSVAVPAADKEEVTKSLDAEIEAERKMAAMVCSIKNKDDCVMCGS